MTTLEWTIEKRKWVWLVAVLFLASCSSGNSSQGLGVYPKSVSAVDETSAIQTLRTIATAQAQSKATRGSFADFSSLVQAGFLDTRFSGQSPNIRGFRFTMTANESDFSVNADPEPTQAPETTGGRHFYLDSTDNAIRVNPGQRASKNDPPL
jgi:hypothetical protein